MPPEVYAPVAQLDRASDFESEGRRFESCRVYYLRNKRVAMIAALFAYHSLRSGVEKRVQRVTLIGSLMAINIFQGGR
jgi:hypothetical protein